MAQTEQEIRICFGQKELLPLGKVNIPWWGAFVDEPQIEENVKGLLLEDKRKAKESQDCLRARARQLTLHELMMARTLCASWRTDHFWYFPGMTDATCETFQNEQRLADVECAKSVVGTPWPQDLGRNWCDVVWTTRKSHERNVMLGGVQCNNQCQVDLSLWIVW